MPRQDSHAQALQVAQQALCIAQTETGKGSQLVSWHGRPYAVPCITYEEYVVRSNVQVQVVKRTMYVVKVRSIVNSSNSSSSTSSSWSSSSSSSSSSRISFIHSDARAGRPAPWRASEVRRKIGKLRYKG